MEQGVAATLAIWLAKKCPAAGVTLAALGEISQLVAMLDSSPIYCSHSALLTLLSLANGNDLNKAAIVDAGSVPRLVSPKSQTINPGSRRRSLSQMSALERNKPFDGISGAIPLLAHIHFFSKMVGVPFGCNSTMEIAGIMETLIEILRWGAHSKCQEGAAYVLMEAAYHNYAHRQAMARNQAVPAFPEVSLLGNELAQKRAIRILKCLREDRAQRRSVSGPMGLLQDSSKFHQRYSILIDS
ncbi:uncharacterized protein [Physcomitrium patens]